MTRTIDILSKAVPILITVSLVGFWVGINVPGWPEALNAAFAGVALFVAGPLAVLLVVLYLIEAWQFYRRPQGR